MKESGKKALPCQIQTQGILQQQIRQSLLICRTHPDNQDYCVHVQKIGWLGWAKDGASAGTSECSLRLETIRIRIVSKAQGAPGNTANAYFELSPEKAISQFRSGREISTVGGFTLPSDVRASITKGIANIENSGASHRFRHVDLNSGKGISYNL